MTKVSQNARSVFKRQACVVLRELYKIASGAIQKVSLNWKREKASWVFPAAL